MLTDILAPGLRLAICGTAASSVSARLGRYYAGPGNRFWRTLFDVGLTPRLLSPAESLELPSFGIGLTDLVKGQSGADQAIQFHGSSRVDLNRKLLRYRPGVLCFNGKRAAREYLGLRSTDYGLRADMVGVTRPFVAPSTSAAARGSWDVVYWQQLASLVGGGCR